MSCYIRHIKELLAKHGINVNPENRSRIDEAVHKVVAVRYKDCPHVWAEVKKRIKEDEEGFIEAVKLEFGSGKP
jgi:hypothetical protein